MEAADAVGARVDARHAPERDPHPDLWYLPLRTGSPSATMVNDIRSSAMMADGNRTGHVTVLIGALASDARRLPLNYVSIFG